MAVTYVADSSGSDGPDLAGFEEDLTVDIDDILHDL